MNVFRVAILCTLVLVVALLFYCVFELLPNQQAAYDRYNAAKEAQKDAQNSSSAEAPSAAQEVEKQPQTSASEQAYEQIMESEEYAVLAEARKKKSEQETVASDAAPLKTTDTLIGKVVEVSPAEAGGYIILKLDFDSYSVKGQAHTVGENTKLYVGCSNGCYLEVTLSPTMDRENMEFLAYVTEGRVEAPAGLSVEVPEPKVGDSVYYWSESHDTPGKPQF